MLRIFTPFPELQAFILWTYIYIDTFINKAHTSIYVEHAHISILVYIWRLLQKQYLLSYYAGPQHLRQMSVVWQAVRFWYISAVATAGHLPWGRLLYAQHTGFYSLMAKMCSYWWWLCWKNSVFIAENFLYQTVLLWSSYLL